MKMLQPFLLLLLALMLDTNFGVEARKSYAVKKRISKGELKVTQPRVKAASASSWCVFTNSENKWCLTGTEEWIVGTKQSYE